MADETAINYLTERYGLDEEGRKLTAALATRPAVVADDVGDTESPPGGGMPDCDEMAPLPAHAKLPMEALRTFPQTILPILEEMVAAGELGPRSTEPLAIKLPRVLSERWIGKLPRGLDNATKWPTHVVEGEDDETSSNDEDDEMPELEEITPRDIEPGHSLMQQASIAFQPEEFKAMLVGMESIGTPSSESGGEEAANARTNRTPPNVNR